MNTPISIVHQWTVTAATAGVTTYNMPATVSIPNGMILRVLLNGAPVPHRWSSSVQFMLLSANAPVSGDVVSVVLARLHSSDFVVAAGTMDFPSIAAGGSADITVTVPSMVGTQTWTCLAAFTSGQVPNGVFLTAFVASAGSITVRCHNPSAAAVDPLAAAVRIVAFPTP